MDYIRYSEIFYSPQGEGFYTGRCSLWIRMFLCNLQCDGFGQKNPTDPTTYSLPYKQCDISDVKLMKDLPVFDKGCDSSYSWSKRFKHLSNKETIADTVDKLEANLPTGKFLHQISNQQTHFCITGGEPLLHQPSIVKLIQELKKRDNLPKYITIETNGTQKLSEEFKLFFENYIAEGNELFFSISPKLFTITGEKRDKAIKPEFVKEYYQLSGNGQLKFVIDDKVASQAELEEVIAVFRQAEVGYDVWCMPLGSLKEQQQDIARKVSEYASSRGFHTCARVHTYLFGNEIGT